jgi:hypothetical protein
MADTIRVTKSSIVVLETDAPTGDGTLRVTKISLALITGVTDVTLNPPTGRRMIVIT